MTHLSTTPEGTTPRGNSKADYGLQAITVCHCRFVFAKYRYPVLLVSGPGEGGYACVAQGREGKFVSDLSILS